MWIIACLEMLEFSFLDRDSDIESRVSLFEGNRKSMPSGICEKLICKNSRRWLELISPSKMRDSLKQ